MKVMNMNMNNWSMNMTWIWISSPWIWISGPWIWIANLCIHMNMSCMNYFTSAISVTQAPPPEKIKIFSKFNFRLTISFLLHKHLHPNYWVQKSLREGRGVLVWKDGTNVLSNFTKVDNLRIRFDTLKIKIIQTNRCNFWFEYLQNGKAQK